MGSEASIYTYNEGAEDYVVNFAQLTQRAGNFLVSREPMEEFSWEDLKGKTVLGGRKGGMPEMVFEYILKQNGLDPQTDLNINQSIDFGSTAAAFSGGQGDFYGRIRTGSYHFGVGWKRVCCCIPWQRERLCTLYGILCKEKLPGKEPGYHPELYQL